MTLTTILKRATTLAIAVGLTAGSACFAHGGDEGGNSQGGAQGRRRNTPHVGVTSGQTPYLTTFICNRILSDADASATWINISGIKGPVLNLQTLDGAASSAGASYAHQLPLGPLGMNRLDFDFQGDCEPCVGPWIYVTAVDNHGSNIGLFGLTCEDGLTTSSNIPGFVHKTYTPADFGLPSNAIGALDIELFAYPYDGDNHNARLANISVNGRLLGKNSKTLFNFCPIGFGDPRPEECF